MHDRRPETERLIESGGLTGDFGSRVRRGGALIFGAQAIRLLVQFASVITLARLLPPEAFGLIAMVAALSTALDLVKELGLSAATIQRTHLTHAQVNALFWINAGAGAAIAAGLAAASPLIADFYGQPALIGVTRWLALGFLISGLTTQHWALLRRHMRFGSIALIDTLSDLCGLAAAVVMAVCGWGYWSLVALRLVPLAINLAGSWSQSAWRPGWPRMAPVRELVLFGLSVTGSGLATALTRSLDQILIGWLWGPVALGLYERAAKLALVPLNNINAPLYTVGLPALSRLVAEPSRYRKGACDLIRQLAMITMPGAALIACTGDWTTALLFGPTWKAAGPLVACFGVVCVVQPTIIVFGLLYLAEDRSQGLLRFSLVDAILTALAFVGGLHFGALGVALSYAACTVFIRLPVAIWLAGRGHHVVARDLIGAILPAGASAVAVAGAVFLLRQAIAGLGQVGPIVGYLIVAPVALACAVGVLASVPSSRAPLLGLLRLLKPLVARFVRRNPRPVEAPSYSSE